MKVNKEIFRGYDLRGLVDSDLSPELAEHLGKAFGTYLKGQGIKEAVIGRDCRETSPEYSKKLIDGLLSVGVDVTDIGMQLVGTLYWAQHFLDSRGGVYVSASHNPKQYNGFKFANDFSETLVSDGMVALRELVESEEYHQTDKPGKAIKKDILPDYFADLISRIPIKKKLKVVIDSSNTTAGAIAPELLRNAGCEVFEYNTEVDPSFPLGIADPTETSVMKRLAQETVKSGADIGFTYDADGDRIGIVDEQGGIIWNDVLVAMFAVDVLREHSGATIMFNTLCSKVVTDTIVKHGGRPYMWRTGHSFLKKKNQEIGAAFIGELSGHFFFSADFYNHDDGLYSTLRILRYLADSGKKLSELVSELPQYVSSPEIKLCCADDKKVNLVKKIVSILRKDFPNSEVIDDDRAGDGTRLDNEDFMLVVRYSQNGPYLTIKFEAKTLDKYEEIRTYIADLLRKFPEIDWKSDIATNVEALEEARQDI